MTKRTTLQASIVDLVGYVRELAGCWWPAHRENVLGRYTVEVRDINGHWVKVAPTDVRVRFLPRGAKKRSDAYELTKRVDPEVAERLDLAKYLTGEQSW